MSGDAIKRYIFVNEEGENAWIFVNEQQGTILILKNGQPTIKVLKHEMFVCLDDDPNSFETLCKSKEQNYLKMTMKIIEEGLKDGSCKLQE